MWRSLVPALCVLLCLAALPGGVAASHDHEYTDFETTPGDRTPNTDRVTYRFAVTITDDFEGDSTMETPETVLFAVDSAALELCSGGGDQWGDLPHSLYVTGPDGDRTPLDVEGVAWDDEAALFGLSDGDQPAIGVGDTLVLELDGCVTNPADDGWYRALVDATGEDPDGESTNITAFSHYFGICPDCTSNEDARSELGPPPSEPDATTTPTATPTPTATATPSPSPTPTATPTATPSPTLTPSRTQTASPTTGTPSETAAGTPSPATRSTTPTIDGGAGFAPVTTAFALVLAAFHLRRRV